PPVEPRDDHREAPAHHPRRPAAAAHAPPPPRARAAEPAHHAALAHRAARPPGDGGLRRAPARHREPGSRRTHLHPARAEAEPPPPPVDTSEVERRLVALDTDASARGALNAVFAAWSVRALEPHDAADAIAFTGPAARRGLGHLLVSSSGTLLRALDLPAILELNLSDASGVRYAAVVSLSSAGATLVVGDA